MKIKQVNIVNYGKWHQVRIPLQTGLNIIYGQNEAGKTTLLSFIKGVLFGYLQHRTSHKNYIPRKSKNYGGQLEISVDSQDYIIQRMAGKNGGLLTVLDSHGNQLDDSILKKILGPFDRNTFEALYYFGTVNLKALGKLKQRDLIYRIQRIGLSHSADWIDYREVLNKRAKELYSPRGYKPPLNQALKRYLRLIDQVRSAKDGYKLYQSLLSRIRQIRHERKRINDQLNEHAQKLDQLNRDRNTWTRYQRMQSLRASVNQVILPGFTDKDTHKLQRLIDQMTHVHDQVKLIQQQLKESTGQRVNNGEVKHYRKHLQLINNLADQFNDIENKLQKVQLMQRRKDDVQRQLKSLKPKYIRNGHLLQPMTRKDYSIVKEIGKQIQDNRHGLRTLSQQLTDIESSERSNVLIKNGTIYGASIILLIMGLFTTMFLSVLGIALGAIWFIYQLRLANQHQTNVKQVQNRIHIGQNTVKALNRTVSKYQNKYRYPTNSIQQWLIMQNDLKHLNHLDVQNDDVKHQITLIHNELSRYFKRWTFMNHVLTLSADQSSQLLQLKNYVNKMDRIIDINRKANVQSQRYSNQLKNVKTKSETVHERLINFYRDRKVNDVNEFKEKQRSQMKLKQQQQTYHELLEQVGSKELVNLKRYRTYDNIEIQVTEESRKIDNLKSKLQQITGQLTASQVKLHHLVHNGSYDELQQRVANAQTQINELADRWLEVTLAGQWINATLNLATKGRVPKIEHQAQSNFQLLTNQRYISIIFNKTQIKVMRNDKQRFTLYELSKGTVQQLYLALIFAMAQVFGHEYPMPLMIDDGFTDFDVNRRAAAIKLLKSIGHQLQVIYCTSDENLLGQNNVMNLNRF